MFARALLLRTAVRSSAMPYKRCHMSTISNQEARTHSIHQAARNPADGHHTDIIAGGIAATGVAILVHISGEGTAEQDLPR